MTRAKPWLEGVSRRTLKDVKRRDTLGEILEKIHNPPWNYTSSLRESLIIRDKALIALTFLSAGRISEVLSLTKEQFIARETEPNFIIIENMLTVKVKQDNIPFREDFPLPLKGRLKPFTDLVLTHIDRIEGGKVFRIKRQRAWQIIKHYTGDWCHYYRAQAQRYYARLFRDRFALADLLNVKNVQSLKPYDRIPWTDFRDRLGEG